MFETLLICVQVPNYLPSISASISLSPESHIWRFCIGLHSAPRFLVAFTYFRFYEACFPSRCPENMLSCVNLTFSLCESLGLLLLTYVSSSETYCALTPPQLLKVAAESCFLFDVFFLFFVPLLFSRPQGRFCPFYHQLLHLHADDLPAMEEY